MSVHSRSIRLLATGFAFAAALLGGCSSRDGDLDQFIAQTRQEQPGGVKPLPEVQPYESFTYQAQTMRSPFVPGGSGAASAQGVTGFSGFYAKGFDGRIDDPGAGWKGRGLWSANGDRTPWLIEGGKGTRPLAAHFQLRPDPLAK